MSNTFYHKEITEAQWNRIKYLFPESKKVGRPPLNPRTVFNAVLWILKSGGRWRDLPSHYGNWNSIYHKFRQWCECGLFELLLQQVNLDTSQATLLEIDSTFCKVHQSACSAKKDQAIGSSRGGKNTKVHVIVNEKMQLMSVSLTGGQIHDSQPAIALLSKVNLEGKTVLADRAYSCDKIRNYLEERGAAVCIPDKVNFKVKHNFDADRYKQRNLVERFFQRIKNYRHVAFRFDKLAVCFLNFVLLASATIHL
jgi:transposase